MISVILSVYNESTDFIKKSIMSILEQTYRNLELIIINDNPKRKELEMILSEYQNADKRVRYLKNKDNIGLVESLNKGIKYAQGEYIARMDADDIAVDRRLEWQLEHLIKNELDIVGGNIDKIDENGKEIGSLYVPIEHGDIVRYQKYGSCVLHPTWLVKRSVYLALGGYRNVQACEDYDFLLRAISQGYKLGNISKIVLKYRVRADGISGQNSARQKLLTFYLASNMDNIQNISSEMINGYINSDKFERDLKIIKRYDSDKLIVTSGYIKIYMKVASIVRMLFNKYLYLDARAYIMRKKREMLI